MLNLDSRWVGCEMSHLRNSSTNNNTTQAILMNVMHANYVVGSDGMIIKLAKSLDVDAL